MRATKRPRPFHPGVTWVGIIILATGLATGPGAPAFASASPLYTSSMKWDSISSSGALAGGIARDFSSGQGGWGAEAFESAGVLGLEWEYIPGTFMRRMFNPSETALNSEPGGESSRSPAGFLNPSPDQTLYVELTTRVKDDQARWSVTVTQLKPDSFDGNSVFLSSILPAGYSPVYQSPTAQTLIVSDANFAHPAIVLSASTTSGSLHWGSGSNRESALAAGNLTPTVYVSSVTSSSVTLTLTAGVIDHDPCSLEAALELAGASAGVYGTPWPTVQSCLPTPAWEPVVSDGSTVRRELLIDGRVPPLASGYVREVTLAGLPDGVVASLAAQSSGLLELELSASSGPPAGDYPVDVLVLTRAPDGADPSLIQPLSTTAVLSLTDPPPPPPEPEPEPAPEPEPEPQPEPAEEPSLEDQARDPEEESPEADAGPAEPDDPETQDPSEVEPEQPAHDAEDPEVPLEDIPEEPEADAASIAPDADLTGEPAPAPAPSQTAQESPAATPPQEAPRPAAAPAPQLPEAIEARPAPPSPTPAPTTTTNPPEEVALAPQQEPSGGLPEPANAGAWLGVGVLGAGVAWWLAGILRRRSEFDEE